MHRGIPVELMNIPEICHGLWIFVGSEYEMVLNVTKRR